MARVHNGEEILTKALTPE